MFITMMWRRFKEDCDDIDGILKIRKGRVTRMSILTGGEQVKYDKVFMRTWKYHNRSVINI